MINVLISSIKWTVLGKLGLRSKKYFFKPNGPFWDT